MIREIVSKTNEKIKNLLNLKDAKTREAQREFLIEGFHLLEMALSAGVVKEVYTIKQLTLNESIAQYLITEDILKKIAASKNPQGVVARCKFVDFKKHNSDRVIYLDGINDPGNVGTIIRTALGFGFDVILGEKCASLYNEKVVASSQGAIFKCGINRGCEDDLIKLKKQGYEIIGASLHNAKSINEMVTVDKMVIVVGNESHGINDKIINLLDQAIIIPINNIESLNVAIASAIMMHATRK